MKRKVQRRDPSKGALKAAAVTSLRSVGGGTFGAVITERMQGWPVGQVAFSSAVKRNVRRAKDVLSRVVSALKAGYAQRVTRRLSVSETVALGEKRFVALLKIDGQEFLIGGGSGGVSLLATLEGSQDARESSR